MRSSFDYQSNCLPNPERELLWGFLVIYLDPSSPGMPKLAYDAAWASAPYAAEQRELAFRESLSLINVHIADFEFVVSLESEWFGAWVDSISAGDSDPFGDCPCNGF